MNIRSLTAKMLSRFKKSLDSWRSIWSFLANLHDLEFYQRLDDPQHAICPALSDPILKPDSASAPLPLPLSPASPTRRQSPAPGASSDTSKTPEQSYTNRSGQQLDTLERKMLST